MKRKRKQGYLEGTLHHMYGTYNTYKLHWFAPVLAIKCDKAAKKFLPMLIPSPCAIFPGASVIAPVANELLWRPWRPNRTVMRHLGPSTLNCA